MNITKIKKEKWDVIVVGAGVIGCCIARELARFKVKILVLEAGLDIANGATKANSGIVHVGYDPVPGTLKAKYNVRGARLYPKWQSELGFAYFKNGALVLAFNKSELEVLQELHERGIANGAAETKIVSAEELQSLEPNVSKDAIGALLVPDSGICDPYGLSFAAAENAAANGVVFQFAERVEKVEHVGGKYQITSDKNYYEAHVVVNAAGIHADEINNQVSTYSLTISPIKGEYALFKNDIHPFRHTMFQAPSKAGKGVLVGMAAFGNAYIGPTAEPQESKTDVSTSAEGLNTLIEKTALTWPGVAEGTVISNFAGIRAKNADTGDFAIGQPKDAPGFFNAACIDSPGLASAPAIAEDVSKQVADYLRAIKNENFNPTREPAPLLVMMSEEEKEKLIQENPRYGVEACGCCQVSEGEILDALDRVIPVLCLDALKWRTGATMGPCQGGKCTGRLAQLIQLNSREEAAKIAKRQKGATLVATDVKKLTYWPGMDMFNQYIPKDSFERPRSMYQIAGSRPAGIYSAYAVLDIMERFRITPGSNVLIWGSTALAAACSEVLAVNGVDVTKVDTDVKPVYIAGEPRVQSVSFVKTSGEELVYECDTFIISAEWVHE